MPTPAETEDSRPEPASPTSLDHRKTTVENPRLDAIERGYRFHELRPYLTAIEAALPSLQITQKQAERFRSCGTNAWIVFSPARQRYRLKTNTCKLRWCPRCHTQVARRISDNLTRALSGKPNFRWKFVTLTTRASKLPLEDQVKHLRTSFRRLRQRKFWKTHVRGGYAVLEITYNSKTHQWHPHLHVVADAEYMQQRQLSKEWLASSRDSFVVDIRAIKNTAAAVGYVSKYLGKLPELSILADTEKTNEWITAIAGSRLINRFGELPEPSDAKFDEKQPADWQPVARLATVLELANRGDAKAITLLALIRRERDEEETDLEDGT